MDHHHVQVLSSHESHDRGCTHRRNFLDKQALVMQVRNCFTGVYTLALSALCRECCTLFLVLGVHETFVICQFVLIFSPFVLNLSKLEDQKYVDTQDLTAMCDC